jgi:hypothetical protein
MHVVGKGKAQHLEPLPKAGYKIVGKGTPNARLVPLPKPASKGPGSTKMQSKTINGKTVLFDPVSGNYYAPGNTKTPIDPNAIKAPPKLTPDKVRTYRNQASLDVAASVKAHSDAQPKDLYRALVGKGTPSWIAVWALRQEAKNHPDKKGWQNVLKRGWATSK